MRATVAVVVLLVASACVAPDGFTLGPPIACPQPTDGIDRITEEGEARGLDALTLDSPFAAGHGCNYIPGAVVAQDLDGDGDIDLAFGNPEGFPHLFENDGAGQFAPVDPDPAVADAVAAFDRALLAVSAVDVDGDGLPDLGIAGEGIALLLRNQGGWSFEVPAVLLDQPGYPRSCFQTMAWGDADGDTDLDLFLPALDPIPSADFTPQGAGPVHGTGDPLLLNHDGEFEVAVELAPRDGPWISALGLFTDRDADGDLDLLVGTDRAAGRTSGSSFFRNDGPAEDGPILVDDGREVGAETWIDAMGVDSADLNGDGLLDYCMSDFADWFGCLVSDPEGGPYIETGAAQGLVTDAHEHPEWDELEHVWTPWGLALVDLDADGVLDAATAAGPTPDAGSVDNTVNGTFHPDTLWWGQADGSFESVSHEVGFNDPAYHYGLASADLDGDGFLELVVGPSDGRPQLWVNRCGAGAWVIVDLVGRPGNTEGFGAQVVIEADGDRWHREMMNLRTVGQSPSRIHFGLGRLSRLDSLEVRWPGGARSLGESLPVNRVITVEHPDAR